MNRLDSREIVRGTQQIHKIGSPPETEFVSAVRKDKKRVYLLEAASGAVISPDLRQWGEVYDTALSWLRNKFSSEIRTQLKVEGVPSSDLENEYPDMVHEAYKKEGSFGANRKMKEFLLAHDIVQEGLLEPNILRQLGLNENIEPVVFWMRGVLFQFTSEGERFAEIGGKIEL